MSNFRAHRAHAFELQHGRCYYCQQPMWLSDLAAFAKQQGFTAKQSRRFQCTAEHLQARCDGGKDRAANIAAACLTCNTRRHRRKQPPQPVAYRALVQRRMKAGRWHDVTCHRGNRKHGKAR